MTKAQDKRTLLAYCGLYCGDCMGYTGVIADAAERFKAVLEQYQFGKTAAAMFQEELAEYGNLVEMVDFMSGLRCPAVCRSRTGHTSCQAKNCCIGNGYFACHECDGFETCDTLRAVHFGIHEEACTLNLKAIRDIGLDAWLESGERHCYWTLDGDGASGRD
ncbi:MAG: DUF3795 domain-containing protein [Candidatus Eisenbacteria bacterium]